MVIIIVWKQKFIVAAAFLVLFGSIELMYLSATLFKVPDGGWIALLLSLTLMAVMFSWNYGTLLKHGFDVENKLSMDSILALGPSLGMVRVPGIGLVYSSTLTGIPAIFAHFVTNLPAFHEVLVFVCVKSVQVPYISQKERFLISRVCPKEYGMFRCIVRFGYKDVQQEEYDFENRLISAIVEFIETEEENSPAPSTPSSGVNALDGFGPRHTYSSLEDATMDSVGEVQVTISADGQQRNHLGLKDESLHILRAKESGLAYILGHSCARGKKSSSIVKKFVTDVVYGFLSRNCRGPNVALNVPYTSLLEVGMVYYV